MEYTIKEMARKLRISEKAVRNRLHRRGIKPSRLAQDVTQWGLMFTRGIYSADVLDKIK